MSVDKYRRAVDAAAIFSEADLCGNIIYVNSKFCAISGYSEAELIGANHRLVNSGHHSKAFFEEMWATISSGEVWHGEICNRTKNGGLYWVDSTIVPLVEKLGDPPTGYASIRFDVTERHRLLRTLAHQAHHDPLTQLPNRALLAERFEAAIQHAVKTGKTVAVCLLDLDEFKSINDSLGHAIGDRLLAMVAERLRSVIREQDLAVRMGGDEFVLLLSEVSGVEEASAIFERALVKLALPYAIGEHSLNVTCSGGASVCPPDNASSESLMRHSDIALYQAKTAGRNCLKFFDATQSVAN